MKKNNLKVISSAFIIGMFLFFAFASGDDNTSDNEEANIENVIKKTFKDGDELFDYVSFGYYGYSDLVEKWGEAEVGRPYLNDKKDGFNVNVTWNNIKANGYVPVFEFSVSDSDGETPISFMGLSVNDYVFEY